MATVKIETTALDELIVDSESAYPYETGGLLLGSFLSERAIITRYLSLPNLRREEGVKDRILISARDVLAAERLAGEQGLDVLGFYHTHPDGLPWPSAYDLEHALPAWFYLIAAIDRGRFGSIRAFRLSEDRAFFDEINLSFHKEHLFTRERKITQQAFSTIKQINRSI